MPEHTNLHKIRHDTADLFRLKLLPQPGEQADTISWAMTPCVVQLFPEQVDGTWDDPSAELTPAGPQWYVARHPCQLLALSDQTTVLCPWPGQKKCDVFRFTVGEFRQAWEDAKAAGTCSDCKHRVWPLGCSAGHDVLQVRPFDAPRYQKSASARCPDRAPTDEAAKPAEEGGGQ